MDVIFEGIDLYNDEVLPEQNSKQTNEIKNKKNEKQKETIIQTEKKIDKSPEHDYYDEQSEMLAKKT